MKYDHNVIKDLLPLYIDDVLSDSSRQIVDEHLDECEDCRKYLNDLKESNKVELNITDTELEKEHADILKLMRKKIVRRNIIISLLSIFIVISIFKKFSAIVSALTSVVSISDQVGNIIKVAKEYVFKIKINKIENEIIFFI